MVIQRLCTQGECVVFQNGRPCILEIALHAGLKTGVFLVQLEKLTLGNRTILLQGSGLLLCIVACGLLLERVLVVVEVGLLARCPARALIIKSLGVLLEQLLLTLSGACSLAREGLLVAAEQSLIEEKILLGRGRVGQEDGLYARHRLAILGHFREIFGQVLGIVSGLSLQLGCECVVGLHLLADSLVDRAMLVFQRGAASDGTHQRQIRDEL